MGAIAQFFVSVNYKMVDYLPSDTQSTVAMEIMDEEFTSAVPNTRVMINDVNIQEALAYKEKLTKIDGVTNVTWLDDVVDLKTPIEMLDQNLVETYYKDNKALISLSIEEGKEVAATDAIYKLIGEENSIDGDAVVTATAQKMTGTETFNATMLLIPIIIIILILSTTSWMEPVFFLFAIGISVLINLGTNIFLGEISFVTASVAPILQLAVSLDYAIFLLHSFRDHREKTNDIELAMQRAMKDSFTPISSSAITTFFGFMALSLMKFEIGADLGLNLVKGIVFSFISVVVFLPALTVLFYKWIDKTEHRPFIPPFKNIGNRILKFRIPVLIIVLLLLVPSYLGQKETNFLYGMGDHPEHTRAGIDQKAIEESFDKSTPIVLLVPKGDMAKELELTQQLEKLENITSVISYVNTVSPVIPPEFLDDDVLEQFYSENYSRIIVNTNAGTEGDIPFSIVENVQEIARSYYGDDAYTLGESVTMYDIKNTVTSDNTFVNLMTVITITLVLMLTLRSLSIPIILVLTIQAAVWINLAIPYFTNSSLVYVGYLIVSTVLLAATVDYAILFADDYKERRKRMPALQAITETVNEKTFSIAVSAAILSSVGYILSFTSSNPVVSAIGLLVGRGALLAFILVLFFLPALFVVLDKLIKYTTWKANFYEEK